MANKPSFKTIAENRKARHDYFIIDSLEAGIVLKGTEVKSLRAGHCSLREAWCDIQDGEIFVKQMHISPYEQGNIHNPNPLRERKLLLHKKEINRLQAEVAQKGYTLLPLSVYLKDSLVKVQVALCKGKKQYDKRRTMAERDAQRAIDRALKERN